MAYAKRDGNNVKWMLEKDSGDKVSERLAELRDIFRHYARPGQNGLDDRFIMELAALQSEGLIALARKQEAELEDLRGIKKDIAVLKAEIAALNKPAYAKLDKPAPKKAAPELQKPKG
jgi:hypothetical protein